MKTALRTSMRPLGLAPWVLLTGFLALPGAWAGGGIATEGNVQADEFIVDGWSYNTFATEVCQSLQALGAPLPADCLTLLGVAIIFTTSTQYDGNLGGLAGADQKCNDHAQAGGLPFVGEWKAVLSTTTTHAATRFTDPGPAVYLLTGERVSASIAALWAASTSSPLERPIDFTELLAQKTGAVWTGGLTPDTATTQTCIDWEWNSNIFRGEEGCNTSPCVDSLWFYMGLGDATRCDTPNPIYCMYEPGL